LDSLLSIVQMPRGVPVATVAVGNAENAGLLAVRILAVASPELRVLVDRHRDELRERSRAQDAEVRHPEA
jgi:5-(carboxyamino)imidazole ribonucleotide mutase